MVRSRLRCFSSHQSSRSCTFGISAKLYSGGGDGIDHSRVRPSHGSAPASSPFVQLLHMLYMKNRNPMASMTAPSVETRFQKSQPIPP